MEKIIQHISTLGKPDSPEGRMERFGAMLDYLLINHSGNICEVGAGAGLTTRIMLHAAKTHSRKVLVIDPFEDEWNSMPDGYGKPYPFSVFADNTIGYRDQLVLCRNNSLSSYAHDALMAITPIAFSFLDGLQYHANVLKELHIMSSFGVEVICIDDINRETNISQVPSAVSEFLGDPDCKYKLVQTHPLIEGYLIRIK